MAPNFTDEYGNKFWFDNYRYYHREDGPAIEGANGSKEWWVNGQLHRIGGPAREGADGHKEWWINGGRYRLEGPIIEYSINDKIVLKTFWHLDRSWVDEFCIDDISYLLEMIIMEEDVYEQ